MSSNIGDNSDNTINHSDESGISSWSNSRVIAPYQLLPTDIRNKIFNQLNIVDRFKLIYFKIDIVDMFNPHTDELVMFNSYNDKIILKSDSNMNLILLAYLCEMRNTHTSRQLSTEICNEIEYRADNIDMDNVVDKFLYRNDMDLLTLEHIYAVLTYILEEYYSENIRIVDIRLLTLFMREVSRRLSKMPRDLFRDHVAVYSIIYTISITLISINHNKPLSIYKPIVDILNTYFDEETTGLFGADAYGIVYGALNNGIVPYYGMDEDYEDGLCVELISNVINPLLLNKYIIC